MSPERWQQIERLYFAALEREPKEREAFLESACAGDQDLRRELEALIAIGNRVGAFMERPVNGADITVQPEASMVGRTLGHYRLISLLAKGGMGHIYLGEDTELRRKVAVKLLPREFSFDEERLRRLKQEARAASALNHPNILTIYEIGQFEQTHYLVTEFIEGETLRKGLDRGPLSTHEALDRTIQVASALKAAHAAGITHRDIKPENVIVRPDGLVKVVDFGLAKLTTQEIGTESTIAAPLNTAPGLLLGTISYMSPEQARGLPVDHRSDIFSLGVMIYELLTGKRPFTGETPSDVIAAILRNEPVPINKSKAGLPPELVATVGRMLAKKPEERPQSASELLNELRSIARRSAVAEAPTWKPPIAIRSGSYKRLYLVGACVVLFAIVAGLFLAIVRPRSGEIRSLAVLPLENLSGDSSQEYFADGMTDALIGDLARIKGLQVISRTSAMHYKGANKPLRQIADELKVDAVVEGTVLRVGDRVQVRAQLIHAATDRHLWTETYDRDLRDVFALQSEIAHAIVSEIQIKIAPADRARLTTNRPVNRKAFDDYLQGRYLFWNRRTEENLKKAITFFQSAIKEDRAYAPPYVGLADCYHSLGSEMIGAMSPMDARRQAQEAANNALEIDNELAEAHAALGVVKHLNWDWAAAEQELKLAIELNPNYAFAHLGLSSLRISKGRSEEAIAEVNRAQQLDPFSLAISAHRGFVLENARHYDEAIEQFRRVLTIDPNHYQALWFLGHTYAVSGRLAEAVESSEKAVAVSRTPGALGFLGMCYGLAGRRADAKNVLDELLELNRSRYVTPPSLANVYIGLGNKDQAFFWLEKGFQERSYYMSYLKVFPGVDTLRSDPRFDDLLRRMGLTS